MESKFVEVKRGNVERLRVSVFERDGYACRYCGSKTPPFHLDHVYPVSKGGETTEDNLVTSCARCNVQKHNRIGLWPKPIGYFESDKDKPRIILKDAIIHTISMVVAMSGLLLMVFTKELAYISLMVFGAGMMFVNSIHTKDHLD